MISNRRLLALLCSVLLSGWSSWALGNSGPKVITNATASVTDISSEAMSIRFSVPRDEIMQSTSRGAAARTKITRFVAIPECDGVALSFPPRFGEPTVGSGRLVQQKWRPEFGKVAGISRIRNQSIAVLELYPFAIADESGQPVASFDVQLRFQNPRGESFRDLGPMSNVLNSLLIHGRAQSVKRTSRANPSNVISHPFESGQVTWAVGSTPEAVTESAVDAHTDYLIVMADELSESLVEDLATRRATFNGLNVTVIKMSQIDSTPDDETHPLQFVLS